MDNYENYENGQTDLSEGTVNASSETYADTSEAYADMPNAYADMPGADASYYQAASAAPTQEKKHENVIAGIVGAFLFSLIGGGLYFIIYQFGYIAGICGLITVVLATFGYQLFSGVKSSMKGIIIAIITSILAIVAAEYLALSYTIYDEFKALYEISFFDAVRATPDFLAEGEIMAAFLKDLAIAFVLGAVASIGNIRSAINANRASK